ncbi:MAG: hypothetical protein IJC18_00920, partial [Clostridia bacterium]|nr:hypothetical protein [Clostridia bacterium]
MKTKFYLTRGAAVMIVLLLIFNVLAEPIIGFGKVFAEEMQASVEQQEIAEIIREKQAEKQYNPDLDYILGRPMTEEEEKEQFALAGKVSDLHKDNDIAVESIVLPESAAPAFFSLGDDTPRPVMASLYDDSSEMTLTSYDLRDYGRVTSAKDQGSFGICWSFAAINSVESNVITRGYANKDSIDLSEKHLAYFSFNDRTDKLGNMSGESVTLPEYGDSEAGDWLQNRGGNQVISSNVLTNWNGVVNEEIAPLDPYNLEQKKDTYAPTLSYSADTYHVRDAINVSLEDTDHVKKMIVKYGAGIIDMVWLDTYYNASTTAYYNWTYGADYSNHAVSVIGWDDNYNKANFKDTNGKIKNNGAWLIQNSWSEAWGDEGCFWMSYEDLCLKAMCYEHQTYDDCSSLDTDAEYGYASFYSAEPAEQDSNLYSYDGVPTGGSFSFADTVIYGANVYTAAATEYLTDVTLNVNNTNVDYSVQIYTGLTSSTNPTSGEAAFAAPQTGTLIEDGYHTIALDTPVLLTQGEKFSIVVEYNTAASQYASLTYDRTGDWGWVSFSSKSSAGQSFYSSNGSSWSDLTGSYSGANLRIRGITGE